MKESIADEIKRVEITRYDTLSKPMKACFLFLSSVGILFAIYFMFNFAIRGVTMEPTAYYYLLMACYSSSVFLILPARKKDREVLPWYDVIGAVLTFAMAFYFFLHAWEIGNVGWVPPNAFQFSIALIFSLLILEGGRRMADLGLDPNLLKKNRIRTLSPPPSRLRNCIKIEGGSSQEKAENLILRLRHDRVL